MNRTLYIPHFDAFIVDGATSAKRNIGNEASSGQQNMKQNKDRSTLKLVSPVQATVDRAESELRRASQPSTIRIVSTGQMANKFVGKKTPKSDTIWVFSKNKTMGKVIKRHTPHSASS